MFVFPELLGLQANYGTIPVYSFRVSTDLVKHNLDPINLVLRDSLLVKTEIFCNYYLHFAKR